MSLALIGAGANLLGGLIGGGRRDKRAMRQLGEIQDAADDVVRAAEADQVRAVEYARQDEARLKAATGYDFVKLRDDAQKAGFNPLTVLGATGGAGYDGRGAVVMSPFISMADAARVRVDARLGAMGTVVETAGYAGDAIANAGAAFVSTALSQAQMLADKEIAAALRAPEKAVTVTPFGASVTKVNANGSSQPKSSYVSGARTDTNIAPNGAIWVNFLQGGGTYVTPEYAAEKGWRPGQTVNSGDMEDDFNQLLGAAGAFDTWLGGVLENSWIVKNYRKGEAMGQARVNAITPQGNGPRLLGPNNSIDPAVWGQWR